MSSRRHAQRPSSRLRVLRHRDRSGSRGRIEPGEIRERTPPRTHRRRSRSPQRTAEDPNPTAQKLRDPAFRSLIFDALKERNLLSKDSSPSPESSSHLSRHSEDEGITPSPSPESKKRPGEDLLEEGVLTTLQSPSPEPEPSLPLLTTGLHEARMMDQYEFISSISQGTYGVVYKGRCLSSGVIKAFKRVKKQGKNNQPESFPLTSLREIQILSSLHHPNIVGLQEVCLTKSRGILKVMDYAEFDLKRILEIKKESFSASEIKCILKQILQALEFLHDHWIMHRDLKPSNILYDNKGSIKLCDFGLARHFGEPLGNYTPLVVTLYYRAPELLLGAEKYSPAIDMWSLGCIMAEIILGKILFHETSELALISSILHTIGEPTKESWADFQQLPNTKSIKLTGDCRNKLPDVFAAGYAVAGPEILTKQGVQFLCQLLELNPQQRLTAKEALEHDYFKEFPPPCHKRLLPTFVDPKKQNVE